MYSHPTEWPVWWDTFDGRPSGDHRAAVVHVRPYTGAYPDVFTHVLTLRAPRTRAGLLEMSVNLKEA